MSGIEETGAGGDAARGPERIPLHGASQAAQRRRLWVGLAVVCVLAAAFGGVVGLFGGAVAGLPAAVVLGLPLLYVLVGQVRRRLWLEGTTLVLRQVGTRRIPLDAARRIDVLVTEMRGARSVALLVHAGRRRAVRVDLAAYLGDRGWELDILALRKLADALAGNTEANGMVFSELLVAQLRSVAREDPLPGRPLYRLTATAPSGKLVQRFHMSDVSAFVASLE
ncbi:hypothetical protein [Haloechinothrix sp. LS1_15]|uniref:hypothetical protein n=1 Tax=Haloechinothrix sp. LS1_15 TaxID=2652248 RepID=UPI002944D8DC|nr:hypothetical protein [Haloechinothrix sp. LS1_15]MDV6013313.1 hypothetical protein [Haloechinothrix sp. LS1_15]